MKNSYSNEVMPERPLKLLKFNWGAFCFSWLWAVFNGMPWMILWGMLWIFGMVSVIGGPSAYSKMVYPCEGYLCAYTVCYFRYLR